MKGWAKVNRRSASKRNAARNSNFDSRHRFIASFSYNIPNFAPAHPRLGKGWQLNGVLTFRSGNPFHLNYNFTGDCNGTGEFFGRPDVVGDPFAGTNGSDRFLNLTAFKVPCTLDEGGNCDPSTFHFGSLGRNSLPGPNYRNFDLSLFKTTPITERIKVQMRAEVFNILNYPNLSSPLLPSFIADAALNGLDSEGRGRGFLPITVTPDVGIGNPFLGGGGSRNIQLAVKLLF